MKTLGIVGGLGPETSANFYLDVVRRYREKVPSYPSILLYNVPLDKKVEDNIIRDSKEEALLLPYLLHAVDILSISSDVIALPCNTAHMFIEEMREEQSAYHRYDK
ncbi:MAG: hypothetical protein D6797_05760 [Bdellovibrio sp.]|nr:MAG: hypothetical protein D6797_05760 [Bdellovibrio sp.]